MYHRTVRERAVAMRTDGLSYREIAAVLGVSKSTLSAWLSGIPLTDEHRSAMEHRARGVAATRADANRALGSRLAAQAASRGPAGSLVSESGVV